VAASGKGPGRTENRGRVLGSPAGAGRGLPKPGEGESGTLFFRPVEGGSFCPAGGRDCSSVSDGGSGERSCRGCGQSLSGLFLGLIRRLCLAPRAIQVIRPLVIRSRRGASVNSWQTGPVLSSTPRECWDFTASKIDLIGDWRMIRRGRLGLLLRGLCFGASLSSNRLSIWEVCWLSAGWVAPDKMMEVLWSRVAG